MEKDNSHFNSKHCILNQNILKKRNFENSNNDGCVNSTDDSRTLYSDPSIVFPYQRITDDVYNSFTSSTIPDYSYGNDVGKRRKLMIHSDMKTGSSNEKSDIESYLSNVDESNDELRSNIHNLVAENFPRAFAEMSLCYASNQGTTCTSNVSLNRNFMSGNDIFLNIPHEPDSSTQCFTPLAQTSLCLNTPHKITEVVNNKKEMKGASKKTTCVKNSTIGNDGVVKNDDLTCFQDLLKNKAHEKKCKNSAVHNTRLQIDETGNVKCALNTSSKKKYKVFSNLSRQLIRNIEERRGGIGGGRGQGGRGRGGGNGRGTTKICVNNDILSNEEEDDLESECDSCITMVDYEYGIRGASLLHAYKNSHDIIKNKKKQLQENKYNALDGWTNLENYYDSTNANVYQSPQDSQNMQEQQRNQHTQNTHSTQGTQTNGNESQNSHEFLNSENRNYHNNSFYSSTDGSYMQGDVLNTHMLNGIHQIPRYPNDLDYIQEERQNTSHNRHSSSHIDFVNFHDVANMRRTHADHPYIFGDEDVYGHQPYGIDEQSQMPEVEELTSLGTPTPRDVANAATYGLAPTVGGKVVSIEVNTMDTDSNENLNNMENQVEMNGNVEYFCLTFPYDTYNQQHSDDTENSNAYHSYQNYQNRRNNNNRNRRS